MNAWSDCHKQKSYTKKVKRNKNNTKNKNINNLPLLLSLFFIQPNPECVGITQNLNLPTYQLPYQSTTGQQLEVNPKIENGFIKTMQLSKMIEHLIYFIFRKPRFVCLPAMYYLQMLRKENHQ
jgi:hypothetical protein